MAYATLSAVKARAGALASAWTDNSRPSNDDVEGFLDDVAAEVTALLGAHGFTAPAAGSAAAEALRNVNADGALVLALEATYPEAQGPSSAAGPIAAARKRYEAALAAVADGSHPAIVLLNAGATAPSATSFWNEEPDYGTRAPVFGSPDANPATAPAFARGQSF